MRKGYTMVELLVTLIIIAVMASLLLPRASKTKAKVDQRQAESYLRAIRISQKMFYARNGKYACAMPLVCNGAAAIQTPLGTVIKEGTYAFSVSSPTDTTFTATATNSDTKTTILNQDGTWSGTYAPLPSA
jgi:type IV pilus assembly protein PilE